MEKYVKDYLKEYGERALTVEENEGVRRVCAWGAKCLSYLRGMDLPPRLKVINVHLFQEEMRLVWKWMWNVPRSTGEFGDRLAGVEKLLADFYSMGLMRPSWAVLTREELLSIRPGSAGHALEWLRFNSFVLGATDGGPAVRDERSLGAPCTWAMVMRGLEAAIAKVWRRRSGLKMEDCVGWWRGIRLAAACKENPLFGGSASVVASGEATEPEVQALEVKSKGHGLHPSGFVRVCTARMKVVAQYGATDVNRWMVSLGDVVPYGEDKSELWKKGSIVSLLGLLRKKTVGSFLDAEDVGLFKKREDPLAVLRAKESDADRVERIVDEDGGIFNAYGSVSLVRNHSYIQSYLKDKRVLSEEGTAWEGVSEAALVLELGFGPKYRGGSLTVIVEGLLSMCDLGALLRWIALLMSAESARMAGRIRKALKAWETLDPEDRDVVMDMISRGDLRRW